MEMRETKLTHSFLFTRFICLALASLKMRLAPSSLGAETVNLMDPAVTWDLTCRQLITSKYNEEVRLEKEAKQVSERTSGKG